jgi:alkanesulfonate monooxygenase SsuD/methylene tetrahydromethanopterin reductase-like flavin-dependent oxidoreductase (luciferase family)
VGLGAFISVGRSLETALQRVELAERLGYESAYVTHIASRDSVTTLMAYAARSERLLLGTGVMPIYSRTPVATAQSFATLDEFSGGRGIIGLGVSHRPVVEAWYGQTIDKPLRDMREYVAVVRAIMRGEDPPQGERFGSSFHFMGFTPPRPGMPIYLAGLSPGMLRLAGEIADGVVLWLCNPEYIREVVVPTVAEGREKAGRSPDGFDIVAAVPSAVTSDPEQAKAQLRSELVPYFSLPFYRKMLERSGFEDDIARFDRAMQESGPEAAMAEISERFLSSLAAIGGADEATASVRRYADSGATSPCLGGISKTDVDATLEALAGSLG